MQQNLYQNSSFPQGLISSNRPPDGNTWSGAGSFSTPVSEAIYVTTATSTWAHTVPSFMPWAPGSSNTTINEPIRFTAPFAPDPCTSKTATSWELLNNISLGKANTNVHLKRRIELEEPAMLPQKQLVTEEKMAARMQNLHISSDYTCPIETGPFPYNGEETNKPINTIQELQVMLSTDESKEDNAFNKSLILSPEIKSLVDPEKLFAKTFVNEIDRPTMAVVLWKPPHGDVKKIINSSRQHLTNDSENNVIMSVSLDETNHKDESNSQNEALSSCLPIDCIPVCEDFEMEA